MSKSIIVEDLGKKYIITHQPSERYTTLRDVIAESTKKISKKVASSLLLKKNKVKILPKREDFWAVRNINFDVEKGEKIGIIGRNGAGKSTILKLLSRVTEPTEGKIKINGRISSLLEVGTGFHPELTGRENIFLNGAILGMKRSEIKKKFDEIVDFAEVEKFLDTPVKRYSSGMYVRLAFAVAAHLESEMLLIDEVLAVGDSQFQKKCLGRMDTVSSEEGKTILFVSHNMATIRNLCNRGILLEEGKVKYIGGIEETILQYEHSNPLELTQWINPKEIDSTEYFDIYSISLLDSKLNRKKDFFNSEKIIIQIDFLANKIHSQMKIQLYFHKYGELAFTFPIFIQEKYKIEKGKHTIFCEIPKHLLGAGNYFISADVTLHNIHGVDGYNNILGFEVKMDKIENMPYLDNIEGYFFPVLNWYIDKFR